MISGPGREPPGTSGKGTAMMGSGQSLKAVRRASLAARAIDARREDKGPQTGQQRQQKERGIGSAPLEANLTPQTRFAMNCGTGSVFDHLPLNEAEFLSKFGGDGHPFQRDVLVGTTLHDPAESPA